MRPLPEDRVSVLVRTCAWALAITGALGMLRLLPWLFLPEVGWGTVAPFAEAVAAKATEMALVVGLPLGSVLGVSSRLRRGGAPVTGANAWGIPLAGALLLFGVGALWQADATQPGRVALDLIDQGRRDCDGASAPRASAVPLVGVAWLCFPGAEPRVAGAVPGTNGRAWFTAASLQANPTLTSFEVRDLRLRSDAIPGLTSARIHLLEARFAGLPAWGRPAAMPVLQRSALLALTAFAAAALALRRPWQRWLRSPAKGALVGGLPAAAVLLVLERLDTQGGAAGLYFLLPLLALAATATVGLALDLAGLPGARPSVNTPSWR